MTPRTGRAVVVLTAASVYYAFLAFSVSPAECFWSGDAGVKFVQVESLLRQGASTQELVYPGAELDPKGAGWPFPPPYGVARQGHFYSTFPPYFPLATIPFYQAFGFAGLRVLPFLGGVATLLAGWFVLRQLALSPGSELAGLLLLAFCSPLAFYSATFWEHAPATALCTVALALAGGLFFKSDVGRGDTSQTVREGIDGRARWWLLLAGVSCGLAFSLRSEALVFTVILAAAVFFAAGWRSVASVWLLAGASLPVACVLGLNHWWFGHPLGLFLEHFLPNPSSRFEIVREMLLDPGQSLGDSNGLLLLFPIILVGLIPLVWFRRFTRLARFHALIGTAFVVAMLLLAPNAGGKQFGPRYLLLGVPSLLVAAAATFPSLFRRPGDRVGGWRRFARMLVLVLGAVSAVRGFQGAWHLGKEKNTLEGPMLRVAAESPAEIIVASHPYFSQQAASLYFDKTLFRVPLQDGYVPDLGDAGFLFAAGNRGVESVLYVDDFRFPRIKSFPLLAPDGKRLSIESGEPTVVGHYRFQLWRLKDR